MFSLLKRYRRGVQITAVVVALSFLYSEAVVAQGLTQITSPQSLPLPESDLPDPLHGFELPPELGRLKDVYCSNGNGQEQTNQTYIIHIQDSHANYSAQQNIEKILSRLFDNGFNGYADKVVICLEGANGDFDFSYFKKFSDDRAKQAVSEQFLKEGKINAAECFILNQKRNIPVVGIENKELYLDNLQAHKSVVRSRKEVRYLLSAKASQQKMLEELVLPKKFLLFSQKTKALHENKISLEAYLDWLNLEVGIQKDDFPRLYQLSQAIEMQNQISSIGVSKERDALIEKLKQRLVKEDLAELIRLTLEYRVGKVHSLEFHSKLLNFANQYKVNGEYPHIEKLISFLEMQKRIDSVAAMEELNLLGEQVKAEWLTTEEQKQVQQQREWLELVQLMLQLEVTRQQLKKFTQNQEAIIQYLNDSRIEEGLHAARAFYQAALKRDHALIDNTFAALKDKNRQLAILITGGFHTQGLMQQLQEKDASHLVISPRLNEAMDHDLYESLMHPELSPLQHFLLNSGNRLAAPSYMFADAILRPGETIGEDALRSEVVRLEVQQADAVRIVLEYLGYRAYLLQEQGKEAGAIELDLQQELDRVVSDLSRHLTRDESIERDEKRAYLKQLRENRKQWLGYLKAIAVAEYPQGLLLTSKYKTENQVALLVARYNQAIRKAITNYKVGDIQIAYGREKELKEEVAIARTLAQRRWLAEQQQLKKREAQRKEKIKAEQEAQREAELEPLRRAEEKKIKEAEKFAAHVEEGAKRVEARKEAAPAQPAEPVQPRAPKIIELKPIETIDLAGREEEVELFLSLAQEVVYEGYGTDKDRLYGAKLLLSQIDPEVLMLGLQNQMPELAHLQLNKLVAAIARAQENINYALREAPAPAVSLPRVMTQTLSRSAAVLFWFSILPFTLGAAATPLGLFAFFGLVALSMLVFRSLLSWNRQRNEARLNSVQYKAGEQARQVISQAYEIYRNAEDYLKITYVDDFLYSYGEAQKEKTLSEPEKLIQLLEMTEASALTDIIELYPWFTLPESYGNRPQIEETRNSLIANLNQLIGKEEAELSENEKAILHQAALFLNYSWFLYSMEKIKNDDLEEAELKAQETIALAVEQGRAEGKEGAQLDKIAEEKRAELVEAGDFTHPFWAMEIPYIPDEAEFKIEFVEDIADTPAPATPLQQVRKNGFQYWNGVFYVQADAVDPDRLAAEMKRELTAFLLSEKEHFESQKQELLKLIEVYGNAVNYNYKELRLETLEKLKAFFERNKKASKYYYSVLDDKLSQTTFGIFKELREMLFGIFFVASGGDRAARFKAILKFAGAFLMVVGLIAFVLLPAIAQDGGQAGDQPGVDRDHHPGGGIGAQPLAQRPTERAPPVDAAVRREEQRILTTQQQQLQETMTSLEALIGSKTREIYGQQLAMQATLRLQQTHTQLNSTYFAVLMDKSQTGFVLDQNNTVQVPTLTYGLPVVYYNHNNQQYQTAAFRTYSELEDWFFDHAEIIEVRDQNNNLLTDQMEIAMRVRSGQPIFTRVLPQTYLSSVYRYNNQTGQYEKIIFGNNQAFQDWASANQNNLSAYDENGFAILDSTDNLLIRHASGEKLTFVLDEPFSGFFPQFFQQQWSAQDQELIFEFGTKAARDRVQIAQEQARIARRKANLELELGQVAHRFVRMSEGHIYEAPTHINLPDGSRIENRFQEEADLLRQIPANSFIYRRWPTADRPGYEAKGEQITNTFELRNMALNRIPFQIWYLDPVLNEEVYLASGSHAMMAKLRNAQAYQRERLLEFNVREILSRGVPQNVTLNGQSVPMTMERLRELALSGDANLMAQLSTAYNGANRYYGFAELTVDSQTGRPNGLASIHERGDLRTDITEISGWQEADQEARYQPRIDQWGFPNIYLKVRNERGEVQTTRNEEDEIVNQELLVGFFIREGSNWRRLKSNEVNGNRGSYVIRVIRMERDSTREKVEARNFRGDRGLFNEEELGNQLIYGRNILRSQLLDNRVGAFRTLVELMDAERNLENLWGEVVVSLVGTIFNVTTFVDPSGSGALINRAIPLGVRTLYQLFVQNVPEALPVINVNVTDEDIPRGYEERFREYASNPQGTYSPLERQKFEEALNNTDRRVREEAREILRYFDETRNGGVFTATINRFANLVNFGSGNIGMSPSTAQEMHQFIYAMAAAAFNKEFNGYDENNNLRPPADPSKAITQQELDLVVTMLFHTDWHHHREWTTRVDYFTSLMVNMVMLSDVSNQRNFRLARYQSDGSGGRTGIFERDLSSYSELIQKFFVGDIGGDSVMPTPTTSGFIYLTSYARVMREVSSTKGVFESWGLFFGAGPSIASIVKSVSRVSQLWGGRPLWREARDIWEPGAWVFNLFGFPLQIFGQIRDTNNYIDGLRGYGVLARHTRLSDWLEQLGRTFVGGNIREITDKNEHEELRRQRVLIGYAQVPVASRDRDARESQQTHTLVPVYGIMGDEGVDWIWVPGLRALEENLNDIQKDIRDYDQHHQVMGSEGGAILNVSPGRYYEFAPTNGNFRDAELAVFQRVTMNGANNLTPSYYFSPEQANRTARPWQNWTSTYDQAIRSMMFHAFNDHEMGIRLTNSLYQRRNDLKRNERSNDLDSIPLYPNAINVANGEIAEASIHPGPNAFVGLAYMQSMFQHTSEQLVLNSYQMNYLSGENVASLRQYIRNGDIDNYMDYLGPDWFNDLQDVRDRNGRVVWDAENGNLDDLLKTTGATQAMAELRLIADGLIARMETDSDSQWKGVIWQDRANRISSTEEMMAAFRLFANMHVITQESEYYDAALNVLRFLGNKMWNASEGYFYAGTYKNEGGLTTINRHYTTDCQVIALLALGAEILEDMKDPSTENYFFGRGTGQNFIGLRILERLMSSTDGPLVETQFNGQTIRGFDVTNAAGRMAIGTVQGSTQPRPAAVFVEQSAYAVLAMRAYAAYIQNVAAPSVMDNGEHWVPIQTLRNLASRVPAANPDWVRTASRAQLVEFFTNYWDHRAIDIRNSLRRLGQRVSIRNVNQIDSVGVAFPMATRTGIRLYPFHDNRVLNARAASAPTTFMAFALRNYIPYQIDGEFWYSARSRDGNAGNLYQGFSIVGRAPPVFGQEIDIQIGGRHPVTVEVGRPVFFVNRRGDHPSEELRLLLIALQKIDAWKRMDATQRTLPRNAHLRPTAIDIFSTEGRVFLFYDSQINAFAYQEEGQIYQFTLIPSYQEIQQSVNRYRADLNRSELEARIKLQGALRFTDAATGRALDSQGRVIDGNSNEMPHLVWGRPLIPDPNHPNQQIPDTSQPNQMEQMLARLLTQTNPQGAPILSPHDQYRAIARGWFDLPEVEFALPNGNIQRVQNVRIIIEHGLSGALEHLSREEQAGSAQAIQRIRDLQQMHRSSGVIITDRNGVLRELTVGEDRVREILLGLTRGTNTTRAMTALNQQYSNFEYELDGETVYVTLVFGRGLSEEHLNRLQEQRERLEGFRRDLAIQQATLQTSGQFWHPERMNRYLNMTIDRSSGQVTYNKVNIFNPEHVIQEVLQNNNVVQQVDIENQTITYFHPEEGETHPIRMISLTGEGRTLTVPVRLNLDGTWAYEQQEGVIRTFISNERENSILTFDWETGRVTKEFRNSNGDLTVRLIGNFDRDGIAPSQLWDPQDLNLMDSLQIRYVKREELEYQNRNVSFTLNNRQETVPVPFVSGSVTWMNINPVTGERENSSVRVQSTRVLTDPAELANWGILGRDWVLGQRQGWSAVLFKNELSGVETLRLQDSLGRIVEERTESLRYIWVRHRNINAPVLVIDRDGLTGKAVDLTSPAPNQFNYSVQIEGETDPVPVPIFNASSASLGSVVFEYNHITQQGNGSLLRTGEDWHGNYLEELVNRNGQQERFRLGDLLTTSISNDLFQISLHSDVMDGRGAAARTTERKYEYVFEFIAAPGNRNSDYDHNNPTIVETIRTSEIRTEADIEQVRRLLDQLAYDNRIQFVRKTRINLTHGNTQRSEVRDLTGALRFSLVGTQLTYLDPRVLTYRRALFTVDVNPDASKRLGQRVRVDVPVLENGRWSLSEEYRTNVVRRTTPVRPNETSVWYEQSYISPYSEQANPRKEVEYDSLGRRTRERWTNAINVNGMNVTQNWRTEIFSYLEGVDDTDTIRHSGLYLEGVDQPVFEYTLIENLSPNQIREFNRIENMLLHDEVITQQQIDQNLLISYRVRSHSGVEHTVYALKGDRLGRELAVVYDYEIIINREFLRETNIPIYSYVYDRNHNNTLHYITRTQTKVENGQTYLQNDENGFVRVRRWNVRDGGLWEEYIVPGDPLGRIAYKDKVDQYDRERTLYFWDGQSFTAALEQYGLENYMKQRGIKFPQSTPEGILIGSIVLDRNNNNNVIRASIFNSKKGEDFVYDVIQDEVEFALRQEGYRGGRLFWQFYEGRFAKENNVILRFNSEGTEIPSHSMVMPSNFLERDTVPTGESLKQFSSYPIELRVKLIMPDGETKIRTYKEHGREALEQLRAEAIQRISRGEDIRINIITQVDEEHSPETRLGRIYAAVDSFLNGPIKSRRYRNGDLIELQDRYTLTIKDKRVSYWERLYNHRLENNIWMNWYREFPSFILFLITSVFGVMILSQYMRSFFRWQNKRWTTHREVEAEFPIMPIMESEKREFNAAELLSILLLLGEEQIAEEDEFLAAVKKVLNANGVEEFNYFKELFDQNLIDAQTFAPAAKAVARELQQKKILTAEVPEQLVRRMIRAAYEPVMDAFFDEIGANEFDQFDPNIRTRKTADGRAGAFKTDLIKEQLLEEIYEMRHIPLKSEGPDQDLLPGEERIYRNTDDVIWLKKEEARSVDANSRRGHVLISLKEELIHRVMKFEIAGLNQQPEYMHNLMERAFELIEQGRDKEIYAMTKERYLFWKTIMFNEMFTEVGAAFGGRIRSENVPWHEVISSRYFGFLFEERKNPLFEGEHKLTPDHLRKYLIEVLNLGKGNVTEVPKEVEAIIGATTDTLIDADTGEEVQMWKTVNASNIPPVLLYLFGFDSATPAGSAENQAAVKNLLNGQLKRELIRRIVDNHALKIIDDRYERQKIERFRYPSSYIGYWRFIINMLTDHRLWNVTEEKFQNGILGRLGFFLNLTFFSLEREGTGKLFRSKVWRAAWSALSVGLTGFVVFGFLWGIQQYLIVGFMPIGFILILEAIKKALNLNGEFSKTNIVKIATANAAGVAAVWLIQALFGGTGLYLAGLIPVLVYAVVRFYQLSTGRDYAARIYRKESPYFAYEGDQESISATERRKMIDGVRFFISALRWTALINGSMMFLISYFCLRALPVITGWPIWVSLPIASIPFIMFIPLTLRVMIYLKKYWVARERSIENRRSTVRYEGDHRSLLKVIFSESSVPGYQDILKTVLKYGALSAAIVLIPQIISGTVPFLGIMDIPLSHIVSGMGLFAYVLLPHRFSPGKKAWDFIRAAVLTNGVGVDSLFAQRDFSDRINSYYGYQNPEENLQRARYEWESLVEDLYREFKINEDEKEILLTRPWALTRFSSPDTLVRIKRFSNQFFHEELQQAKEPENWSEVTELTMQISTHPETFRETWATINAKKESSVRTILNHAAFHAWPGEWRNFIRHLLNEGVYIDGELKRMSQEQAAKLLSFDNLEDLTQAELLQGEENDWLRVMIVNWANNHLQSVWKTVQNLIRQRNVYREYAERFFYDAEYQALKAKLREQEPYLYENLIEGKLVYDMQFEKMRSRYFEELKRLAFAETGRKPQERSEEFKDKLLKLDIFIIRRISLNDPKPADLSDEEWARLKETPAGWSAEDWEYLVNTNKTYQTIEDVQSRIDESFERPDGFTLDEWKHILTASLRYQDLVGSKLHMNFNRTNFLNRGNGDRDAKPLMYVQMLDFFTSPENRDMSQINFFETSDVITFTKANAWANLGRYLKRRAIYQDSDHESRLEEMRKVPRITRYHFDTKEGHDRVTGVIYQLYVNNRAFSPVSENAALAENTWTGMDQPAKEEVDALLLYGKMIGRRDYEGANPYERAAEDSTEAHNKYDIGYKFAYTDAVIFGQGQEGTRMGIHVPWGKYAMDSPEMISDHEAVNFFHSLRVLPNWKLGNLFSSAGFYGSKPFVVWANIVFFTIAIFMGADIFYDLPLTWVLFIPLSYMFAFGINFSSMRLFNEEYGWPWGFLKFAWGLLVSPGYFFFHSANTPKYDYMLRRKGMKGIPRFPISGKASDISKSTFKGMFQNERLSIMMGAMLVPLLLFAPYHPIIFWIVSVRVVLMLCAWIFVPFAYEFNAGLVGKYEKEENWRYLQFGLETAILVLIGTMSVFLFTGGDFPAWLSVTTLIIYVLSLIHAHETKGKLGFFIEGGRAFGKVLKDVFWVGFKSGKIDRRFWVLASMIPLFGIYGFFTAVSVPPLGLALFMSGAALLAFVEISSIYFMRRYPFARTIEEFISSNEWLEDVEGLSFSTKMVQGNLIHELKTGFTIQTIPLTLDKLILFRFNVYRLDMDEMYIDADRKNEKRTLEKALQDLEIVKKAVARLKVLREQDPIQFEQLRWWLVRYLTNDGAKLEDGDVPGEYFRPREEGPSPEQTPSAESEPAQPEPETTPAEPQQPEPAVVQESGQVQPAEPEVKEFMPVHFFIRNDFERKLEELNDRFDRSLDADETLYFLKDDSRDAIETEEEGVLVPFTAENLNQFRAMLNEEGIEPEEDFFEEAMITLYFDKETGEYSAEKEEEPAEEEEKPNVSFMDEKYDMHGAPRIKTFLEPEEGEEEVVVERTFEVDQAEEEEEDAEAYRQAKTFMDFGAEEIEEEEEAAESVSAQISNNLMQAHRFAGIMRDFELQIDGASEIELKEEEPALIPEEAPSAEVQAPEIPEAPEEEEAAQPLEAEPAVEPETAPEPVTTELLAEILNAASEPELLTEEDDAVAREAVETILELSAPEEEPDTAEELGKRILNKIRRNLPKLEDPDKEKPFALRKGEQFERAVRRAELEKSLQFVFQTGGELIIKPGQGQKKPAWVEMFDRAILALYRELPENNELNRYWSELLNREDNRAPPVTLQLSEELDGKTASIRKPYVVDGLTEQVDILFSREFVEKLYKLYQQGNRDVVVWLIAERLFHEFGHGNQSESPESRFNEEVELILQDLALNRLTQQIQLQGLPLQEQISAFIKENHLGPLFPGFLFNFLGRLSAAEFSENELRVAVRQFARNNLHVGEIPAAGEEPLPLTKEQRDKSNTARNILSKLLTAAEEGNVEATEVITALPVAAEAGLNRAQQLREILTSSTRQTLPVELVTSLVAGRSLTNERFASIARATVQTFSVNEQTFLSGLQEQIEEQTTRQNNIVAYVERLLEQNRTNQDQQLVVFDSKLLKEIQGHENLRKILNSYRDMIAVTVMKGDEQDPFILSLAREGYTLSYERDAKDLMTLENAVLNQVKFTQPKSVFTQALIITTETSSEKWEWIESFNYRVFVTKGAQEWSQWASTPKLRAAFNKALLDMGLSLEDVIREKGPKATQQEFEIRANIVLINA